MNQRIIILLVAILVISQAAAAGPKPKRNARLSSAGGRAVTVILDGIWGGHTQWNSLRDRISREIGPCVIWKYDNSGRTGLEAIGGKLARFLARQRRPLNIVGFSMGGLVVREAQRQKPDLPIDRAVLVNTPHDGSLLAHLLPLPACRDMRPRSQFLRRLDAASWNAQTAVIWCPLDLTVVPGASARWPRADTTIRCDVPAHVWPIFSRSIHKEIAAFLGAG